MGKTTVHNALNVEIKDEKYVLLCIPKKPTSVILRHPILIFSYEKNEEKKCTTKLISKVLVASTS